MIADILGKNSPVKIMLPVPADNPELLFRVPDRGIVPDLHSFAIQDESDSTELPGFASQWEDVSAKLIGICRIAKMLRSFLKK